jgi:fermentation-respiration switch protein FrsA (DUF1100 family)
MTKARRRKTRGGPLWAVAALTFALLGAGCDNMLSGFIFFPDRHLESTPVGWGLPHQEVWVAADDGPRLHGWHLPAPSARTLMLFCHGNAGNISHRLDNIARLLAAGISVYIFDYRGYGLSEGSPSEKGLYLDAEAAQRKAQELAQAGGQRLVIFGRSLGGVAAVHLARRGGCAGVVLESTFTNLGAMARVHYHLPLTSLLAGRFDSLGRIAGLRCPALFIHGDQDDVVPYALGRQLYEAAPNPKEFLTIPGAGHNDTYQVGGPAYFQRLRGFCEGLPPP